MNNLSIEQRARIFQNAPEGYDWAAMDGTYLWCAYKKRPYMDSDSSMWWPQRYDDFIDLPGLEDIKIEWQQSRVTRPTNEELKTLYK